MLTNAKIIAALLFGAASVSTLAPRRIATVDPIGRYELTTTLRGKETAFVAKIEKLADGSLGGQLSGNGVNTVEIIDVGASDSTVKFSVYATHEVKANFVMVFHGDSISGQWSMAEDGSPLKGRRLH